MTLSLKVSDGRTVATRKPTRVASISARNYQAAANSRFVSDWTTDVLTSDEALERELRRLVARSREQRRNNDYVRHFDALARVNIIGKNGVVVRPRPLTKKNEIDEQAKTAVVDAWGRWGQRENCDVTGRHSWIDVQNMSIASCVQSGEFLVRKIVGADAGPFGFALQLFDPLSLEPTFRKDLPNGNFIRLSIEFDELGRVVAYWLRTRTPARESSMSTMQFGGSRFVRVRAGEIYHVFLPEEVGQKRGVPWIATSLLRLRMLEAYQEAALIAARAGANKVAFLTRKRNRGYRGPTDGEGMRTMNAEPGTIEEIEEGAELLNFDPSYPHGEFDSFVKRNLQGMASGLLVSYTTLANDNEGASFSSERGRKNAERDVWSMFQTWIVDHFCRPVFNDWLPFALVNGQVTSGGRVYSLRDFERLSRVRFAPRTWTWAVNPLQEVTAAKLEVDAGFRSRDDVIVSTYGKDPVDVDEEILESQTRATEKKIALSDPSTVAITVDTSKGSDDV